VVQLAVPVEHAARCSLELGVVGSQEVRQGGSSKFIGGHSEAVGFLLETFSLRGWQLESQLHDLHFTPSSAV